MYGVIDGFFHRPGVHCDSTSLRDIFEYHSHNFSEHMIFGLGSGLGFLYWKDKRMPFPFIGGRINLLDLTKNLRNNLNVKVKIHETKSRKRTFNSLVSLIKQGFPVMIHVDMPYLKYLQLPLEAHFGGHTVVIAGINEEKNESVRD